MKIKQTILTNNPCFTSGKKITVKGLMLHSVGCPQPDATVFVERWNDSDYDDACVHGFIDANDGTIYQTLPWNHRGWHCGDSGNNTHIGVEMCEPDCIKYTSGATFTCSNKTRAKAMVTTTYNAAVELFAYLCKEYGLNPLQKGVIVSHKEGYAMGIASGHDDPDHLWSQLGMSYTMDTFRRDVAKAMGDSTPTPAPSPTPSESTYPQTPFTVVVKVPDLNIRKTPEMGNNVISRTGVGTFTITEVQNDWGLLKAYAANRNGWIYLGNPDYCFIKDTVKAEVNKYPKTPFSVKILIDNLNYRSAPSMDGIVRGQTGIGTFTITEVQNGFGRLKSGAGWVYLDNPDYCTIIK